MGKKGGRVTQRTEKILRVLSAAYDCPDKQTAMQQHTIRFDNYIVTVCQAVISDNADLQHKIIDSSQLLHWASWFCPGD